MLKKMRYRKFLLVSLGALLGSFLGWLGASLSVGELARREFEAAAGLERSAGAGYFIQPPYSALGLAEEGIDRNEDGRLDRWVLQALYNKRFGLRFDLYDTDFDGDPEQLFVIIGPEGTMDSYNYHDDNGDGTADRIWVSIGDRRTDSHHYTYDDLNFDGRIDLITEHRDNTPVDRKLVYEDRLYAAQLYDFNKRVFWVWTDQETWETVRLTYEGEWIPFERDDSSPPDSENQIRP